MNNGKQKLLKLIPQVKEKIYHTGRKLVGAAFLLLLVSLLLAYPFPKEKEISELTIGSPDDTGGLVVYYLLHEKKFNNLTVEKMLTDYPINDCCTNSAQWALSTDLLDLAMLCPDAAKSLVAKDDRFQIWGPCLLNSEIIVQQPGVKPAKIGVMHGRAAQEEYIKEYYGAGCSTVPMLVSALPYAYERGIIDAMVIDGLKAFNIPGVKLPLIVGDADRSTYVLVVRKDKINSRAFQEFVTAWNMAVQELERTENIKKLLTEYTGLKFQEKEVRMWSQLKIKFPVLQVPVVQ